MSKKQKPRQRASIKQNRKYSLYCVTNTVNNKSYVGITFSIKNRWKDHIKSSQDSKRKYAFQAAVAKYGPQKFKWQVLETYENLNSANEAEEFFIAYLQTLCPNGYNILKGGNNRSLSEETKNKISETLKTTGFFVGKKGSLHPNYGRKNTEQSKQHLRNLFSGEGAAGVKLNTELVKTIYQEYLDDIKIYPTNLAKKYDVAMNTIRNILKKKSWKDATKNFPDIDLKDRTKGENFVGATLTNEQVRLIKIEIRDLQNKQEKRIDSKLARKFQISSAVIFNIRTNKCWKSVRID